MGPRCPHVSGALSNPDFRPAPGRRNSTRNGADRAGSRNHDADRSVFDVS